MLELMWACFFAALPLQLLRSTPATWSPMEKKLARTQQANKWWSSALAANG